jgi:hypothetical protein
MLGPALRRRLLVAAALILVCAAAAAALAAPAQAFIPTIEPAWSKSFDGGTNSVDRAHDIGIFEKTVWVCGTWRDGSGGQDTALVRVPTNGLRAREFTWRGPRGRDAALAMAVARDGSVYTAGYSGGATREDLRLIKWSSLGRVVWTRRYDGPSHGDDGAVDVVVDRWGNVTVCGYAETSLGSRMVVASYDSSGGLRWLRRRTEMRGAKSAARALCLDGLGNVYVTGERWSNTTHRTLTVKYSRAGDYQWSRLVEGDDGRIAFPMSIVRCPSGGVYVAGGIGRLGTASDPLLMRYTASGELTVFNNGENHGENGHHNAVAVASDGSVIAGGVQDVDCAACPQAILYDAAGAPLASWLWDDCDCEWPAGIHAVAADAYGHVYWAGAMMPTGADMRPVIDCRPVGAGDGAWTGAWSAGGSFVEATDCVVSGTTLYVAGVHDRGAQNTNLFVLKYAP